MNLIQRLHRHGRFSRERIGNISARAATQGPVAPPSGWLARTWRGRCKQGQRVMGNADLWLRTLYGTFRAGGGGGL
jgi:hypothetical protein